MASNYKHANSQVNVQQNLTELSWVKWNLEATLERKMATDIPWKQDKCNGTNYYNTNFYIV